MSRLPVGIGVLAYVAIAVASVAFVAGTTMVSESSAIMVSLGLNALGVIGLAGLLLARAPWSRWFLGSTITMSLLLASSAHTALALVSLFLGAGAIVGLAGPWLMLWVRQRPLADGIGNVPGALIASGAATPIVVGLGALEGVSWVHWAMVAVVGVSAWAYGRGLAFGIWGFRVALPLAGIATVLTTPRPGTYLIGVAVLATSATAWTRAATRLTSIIVPPEPRERQRRDPHDAKQ